MLLKLCQITPSPPLDGLSTSLLEALTFPSQKLYRDVVLEFLEQAPSCS
jgi:hypothetical protein